MQVADGFQMTDGVDAVDESTTTIGGLPAKEGQRSVLGDGQTSSMDVDRQTAPVQVRRTASHPKRYHQNKTVEELEAVKRMLPAYNKVNGSDYDTANWAEDQNSAVDVVTTSKTSGAPEGLFQITKIDDKVWRDLAQKGSHKNSPTENEYLKRVWRAVEDKQNLYASGEKQKIVLVLDDWGVTTKGTVENFQRKYDKKLKTTGFKEVWWSSRASSGVILKLS